MQESQTTEFARLLEKSGLAKEEIAARTGYTARTIYRWEKGETQPKKAIIDWLKLAGGAGKPYPALQQEKFRFIDLFAGIGGLRMGFESVGGKCVFTSEWDQAARKTYQANFECEHPIEGDITKIDVHGTGCQAAMAYRAVIGHVIHLLEMPQGDTAPGLLLVEEGLGHEIGGKDLVAR